MSPGRRGCSGISACYCIVSGPLGCASPANVRVSVAGIHLTSRRLGLSAARSMVGSLTSRAKLRLDLSGSGGLRCTGGSRKGPVIGGVAGGGKGRVSTKDGATEGFLVGVVSGGARVRMSCRTGHAIASKARVNLDFRRVDGVIGNTINMSNGALNFNVAFLRRLRRAAVNKSCRSSARLFKAKPIISGVGVVHGRLGGRKFGCKRELGCGTVRAGRNGVVPFGRSTLASLGCGDSVKGGTRCVGAG